METISLLENAEHLRPSFKYRAEIYLFGKEVTDL